MQLIINADDYGWDEDANAGILALCEAGKLQGVSIMANFASEEALKKIAVFKNHLRLGIHIVLNEGHPVAKKSEVLSLSDLGNDGKFYSTQVLWQRYLLGQIWKKHISVEIRAQYEKLKDHGISVSHADSHQHIHQFPFLGKSILQVLKEVGITSIRNSMPHEKHDKRRKLLTFFCSLTHHHLSGFAHNETLITYLASGHNFEKEKLETLLRELRKQQVKNAELMCHPAISNREDSYLKRKEEFEFLMEL